MDKDKLESLLIGYIDGTLTDTDRLIVEQELAQHETSCLVYEQLKTVVQAMHNSPPVEPSGRLKTSFDQVLKEEVERNGKNKTAFFHPTIYRVAASVTLLMIAGGIGFWISRQQQPNAELEAMRKEVQATKMMLMTMLENNQSASQRVQGANVAYTLVKADDEIVQALVSALNEDPNTNVRLAALDALSKFHQDPAVRSALIKSLRVQTDPSVQLVLIQLMVSMKEKSVIRDLEEIVGDEGTLKAVKDEAYKGLLKLT
ncbi:MAG: HEAT repeat domain-containing protein [Cyclobacteriaceae bacterium]|nr:HEAT repeat domain-containing protein [Cyclobacteriaceae bacterium]